MPDPSKFRALKSADFSIPPTCARCGFFVKGANGWGTCRVIPYQHEKHTGDTRFASVPADGTCPGFTRCESEIAKLGAHVEFFNG